MSSVIPQRLNLLLWMKHWYAELYFYHITIPLFYFHFYGVLVVLGASTWVCLHFSVIPTLFWSCFFSIPAGSPMRGTVSKVGNTHLPTVMLISPQQDQKWFMWIMCYSFILADFHLNCNILPIFRLKIQHQKWLSFLLIYISTLHGIWMTKD